MPHCEKCPIMYQCQAWKEAEVENSMSYHPREVARVTEYDSPPCPLIKLIKPIGEDIE